MSAINRVIVVNDDSRHLTHRVIEVLEEYDDVQEAAEQAQQAAQDASQAAGEASQAAQDASQAANDAVAAVAVALRTYPSRAALVSALPSLQDGMTVLAGGQPYIIDSNAIGWRSAMADLGVDGVVLDEPINAYVAAWFADDGDNTIYFYTSPDGKTWSRLNDSFVRVGNTNRNVLSRDPSLVFFRGEFWMSVTNYAEGSHDAVIFRSRDLMNWRRFEVKFGPVPNISATVPFPGGIVPASFVWAPELVVDGDDLYAFPTIRYGNDVVDDYGSTIQSKRIFRSRLVSPDTMEFSALEYVPLGDVHPKGTYQAVGEIAAPPSVPLRHINGQSGMMGLDITFSQDFRAAFPADDLIIIPAAAGATSFSGGNWIAGGSTYINFVSRVNTFLAANPDVVLEAMIWQQGEDDRNNSNYQSQLADFFVRARGDIPALSGVPLLLGEMGTFVPAGTTDINAVIAAVAAATPNAHVVSSAGLTDKGDSLHFNAASYRTLGHRYFSAFASARGSTGSGPVPQRRAIIIAGQSNAVGQDLFENQAVIGGQLDAAAEWKLTEPGWWFVTKDEKAKTCLVFDGDAIDGGFDYVQTLTAPYMVEGFSLVPHTYLTPAGVRDLKWRIYCDAHADLDNVPLGKQFYWELPTPGSSPEAFTAINVSHPVRHGGVKNLAVRSDAAALPALYRAAVFMHGDPKRGISYSVQLASGARSINPQEGVLYYVGGTGSAVTLTIKDGAADMFHLAALTFATDSGIRVLQSPVVAWPVALGFGDNVNQVVTFRRGPNGLYYPDLAPRAAFSAHKGGTPQTIGGALVQTAISFPSEEFDSGASFDVATGMWTPPPGRYRVTASVRFTGGVAGANNSLLLLRDGAVYRRMSMQSAGAGDMTLDLTALVRANGSNAFGVAVVLGGSGDKTISGAAADTWFEGGPL